MNKNNVLTRKQQYLAVALSIVLSLLVVWGAVFGATTISNNINTGGTLTVTGVSTLTGAVTMSSTLTLTDDLVVDTDTLFVDNSANNVGVGTATPSVNAMLVVGEGINTYTGDVYMTGGLTIAATTSSNNSVEGSFLLSSTRLTDPTAVEGLFYYNAQDKVLKMSDGTNWFTVGTTTGGLTVSGSRIQLSTLASQFLTLGTTTEGFGGVAFNLVTLEATSTQTIPLTLRGRNAQLANLFLLVDAGDTELFAIDALGNASGTQLTLSSDLTVSGSITGFVSNASSSIAANLNVAGPLSASSTLTVAGLATIGDGTSAFVAQGSSTVTGAFRVGAGSSIGAMVFGMCFLENATIVASSTGYTDCSSATGVLASDRVFVQATSSLASRFIIQSASSSVAGVINVQIYNTGYPIADPNNAMATGSLNFWAVR